MCEARFTTVEECLRQTSRHTKKIQTQDYQKSGKYPIVDQGRSLIGGWTDDDHGLISDDLPVVVFGDHTRALKYIDFPFIRGADGTQLLKPKKDINSLFFFYALRSIDLPSRGYNRHFKPLKESVVRIPSTKEQREISRSLRLVEEALKQQDEILVNLELLKRAVMNFFFNLEPEDEEREKLTLETNEDSGRSVAPKSSQRKNSKKAFRSKRQWSSDRLDTHFLVETGGTPSRRKDKYWRDGDIPWVKTGEIDYELITKAEEYISQDGLDESAAKLLPTGTILLAMYGQGVTRGKVAILGIHAACNQACAAMRPTSGLVDSKYLYHFLTYRYEEIRDMAHGGQQQNLNLNIVRAIEIAYPSTVDEQRKIVAILDAIDRKIDLHRHKRAVLDDLFKTLLHKLMTGEIRVVDLDLSVFGESSNENSAEAVA